MTNHTHVPTSNLERTDVWCLICDERLNHYSKVPGCTTCTLPGAPAHFASALCQSGKYNHCSCDMCF